MADLPNGNGILIDIYFKKNQSAWVTKAYKQYINDEVMNAFQLVAMITPENIHQNSFMFEPNVQQALDGL